MHFDFTISIGNIVTICVAAGAVWRMEGLLRWFMVEHEILIQDYCKRVGIEIKELPTRTKLWSRS